MMRHLTAGDFRVMPWANGRGQTVEMWRQDRDGQMLWRISRASVTQDGAFSLFPGMVRSLTVLDGHGFDLVGPDLGPTGRLDARLLVPVDFAGDVPIRAENVLQPCQDFNVMVRRGALRAKVFVAEAGRATGAIFALGIVRAGDVVMQRFDLLVTDQTVEFEGFAIGVDLVTS